MKTTPKSLFYMTLALLAAFTCTTLQAAKLKEQKQHATELAEQFDNVTDDEATAIAESLGDAFGEQEDVDALLNRVEKLSKASPKQADAIVTASTAFVPTREYAIRAAAVAARAVPSMATNIAQALSRQFPGAANAIAAAVQKAAPGVDPGSIAQAAQQGAQQASTAGGPSGGGALGGGAMALPGGGGGGGSGGGGGGSIY